MTETNDVSTLELERDARVQPPRGAVVVVVLDGIGIGRRDDGDAVHLAHTPTLDWLDEHALRTDLFAHGTHVGMPSDGDMGNSEVGHNALGAGRIFDQGAKLVENSISSGRIFESQTWRAGIDRVVTHGGSLHLMGLLSDGNVHSHIDHVFALIRRAHEENVQRLRVHALQDGRDVGATSALEYIDPLESLLSELRDAGRDYRIASGGGRMYVTMDRYEADWSIVERGWHAHVQGDARAFESAREAIETLRAENPGISDQYLPPWTVERDGEPVGPIEDGDTVFFWNFRGDRAIEMTRAFEEGPEFEGFDRGHVPDVYYAGMMQYDGDLELPTNFLVEPPELGRPMGLYLAHNRVDQLAVSETQKFGHVTYFWNGNNSGYIDEARECYIEIPSDRVDFWERPWMKAAEITDATIDGLRGGDYGFARINYPNGDMVGHTGNLDAAIIAVEATDLSLRRLLDALEEMGGIAIVTADHGNCDEMFKTDKKTGGYALDENGERIVSTSHSLNRVPLWIYDPGRRNQWELDTELEVRRLSNVASTAFRLLGFVPPEDYDRSLIKLSSDS